MKSQTVHSVIRNPKWEIKPWPQKPHPSKRWGHTSTLNKNKLFIYGGKTGKPKESLYEVDCQTFYTNTHQMTGFPESRESHSCSLVKEKLIIWGGCRQDKSLNDCLSITMKDNHCFWCQIIQYPMLKQRESHATTVLKDKYIFLYGGSNEDDIYDDFWVLNTDIDIWFEIKNITGKMKKRLGCTLTTIKDKIYMFGGELEDETYENEVYCLTLSDLEFTSKQRIPEMRCQRIAPLSGVQPQGRSCHSTVCYSDRYLIIIAGEGQGVDSKGKTTSVLLNDAWSFDTQKLVWEFIEIPNNSIFKPRSCFTANIYKNKIIIFGGLTSTQNFKSSDQLLVLSFSQATYKPLDICNICKLHYRPIQPKTQRNTSIQVHSRSFFDFGLSNLYKISRMIKNPFDAICLIIEAYEKMKYRALSVDLIEGKILIIQGSGQLINQEKFGQILQKYEFVDEINAEDPLILDALQQRIEQQNLLIFGFNLKNACSRLGQTFLFINRRNNLVDLMLVNHENILYCEINKEDSSVGQQQERSAQIIYNYVHRNNINLMGIQNQTFVVIVTDLQRISPTQSQMRVNGKNLIQIAGSSKKTTLQSYISTLFLTKPTLTLSLNSKPFQFKPQKTQYQTCTFEPTTEHDLKTIKLRQCEKQEQICIYRGGIRIARFSKKGEPYVEGYVEISSHYQLNLLRNRIENSRVVEEQLEKICEEFGEVCKKRKNQVPIQDLENISKNA